MATVTLSKHPVFESITGLTNTTFDPDNYQEDRMATEAQIVQVERAIGDLQARKEHCCREIVTWRSYVRVIAQDTGIVLSDWLDNMQVGVTRRGEQFTVEFALPHDSSRYLDDRSSYKAGEGNYNTAFAVRANIPGKVYLLEEIFLSRCISNANARPASLYNFDDYIKTWTECPNSNSEILFTGLDYRPLPAASNQPDVESM